MSHPAAFPPLPPTRKERRDLPKSVTQPEAITVQIQSFVFVFSLVELCKPRPPPSNTFFLARKQLFLVPLSRVALLVLHTHLSFIRLQAEETQMSSQGQDILNSSSAVVKPVKSNSKPLEGVHWFLKELFTILHPAAIPWREIKMRLLCKHKVKASACFFNFRRLGAFCDGRSRPRKYRPQLC